MPEKLAQGAEAVLLRDGQKVIKERISKSYRHPELDSALRASRTKREAKVLQKLSQLGFPAPTLLDQGHTSLTMSFVDGQLLRDVLHGDVVRYGEELGRKIAQLHSLDLIHGDLTTSNMIVMPSQELSFIDFGLSFFSSRTEDRAVDLHLLRQALESKHHKVWRDCFEAALATYSENFSGAAAVLEQLKKVEARGRYKER